MGCSIREEAADRLFWKLTEEFNLVSNGHHYISCQHSVCIEQASMNQPSIIALANLGSSTNLARALMLGETVMRASPLDVVQTAIANGETIQEIFAPLKAINLRGEQLIEMARAWAFGLVAQQGIGRAA